MAKNKENSSFLTAIWHRIKRALSNDYEQAHPSPRLTYQMNFLERCWVEDCLVEKQRKQLEHQWQEVSN